MTRVKTGMCTRLNVQFLRQDAAVVRMLLLTLLLIGCSKIDNRPAKKDTVWYPQTCLKCGSKFDVCPTDPKRKVNPTVEWCFNDGTYCEDGFLLLQDILSKNPLDSAEVRFIAHCRVCDGCKCAAYEPDEWHALIESLDAVESE